MKVIFTAFSGKLMSKSTELPENTTERFRLPMDLDVLEWNSKNYTMDSIPKRTIGVFQYTGKHFVVGNETAREYCFVGLEF